jgi:fatty-acyl-CoA synthase
MNLPSYSHGASPVALLGETIGANLRRSVDRWGDREALVAPAQNYRATYRELWDATTSLAKALLARGVERGDRIGIWSPNRFEWVVVQYAAARVGAILVNVNPAYKARELGHALNQSGLTRLLLARGFRRTDYLEILDRVRHECPTLRDTIVLDDEWVGLLDEGLSVDDEQLAAREVSLTFDDPINIQYTSGTTGAPKGATLSHHSILNNGFFCGEVLRYTELDRVCVPVPFYHCFGMVIGNLACTSHGACIVVPGEAFDPEVTLSVIETERCTSLYGVPTMFIAQLDHSAFEHTDFSSLRTGVMAGSPCPVEVMKQVRERMHIPEITICYGMTETSPVSTQTRVDDPIEKRVASVGPVHPHVEVKIVDREGGHVVPRGESGELCTRGYSVMLGYWNDETATTSAIDRGRWMHTGDLASMDADGYVSIVGRIKDMIIRGGDNIYPREVEELLYTHPGVADAQVIGIPSARYGEDVMAWVKPKPDADLDATGLTAFCHGAIATYKIPRHWKIVDAFPMTVTGKIQKYRMREISTKELGLGSVSKTPAGSVSP